jgi:hypothetical protein
VDPDVFSVSAREWRRVIDPAHRHEVLCRPCYDVIDQLTRGREQEASDEKDDVGGDLDDDA